MATNHYPGSMSTLHGLIQQKTRISQNISRETKEIENALAHGSTFRESQICMIAEGMNVFSAASKEYAQLNFDSKQIKAELSEKMGLKAKEDLVLQSIEYVDNGVLDSFKTYEAKVNEKMQASTLKITQANNKVQAQETKNLQMKEKLENRKKEIDCKKDEYSKKMKILKDNEMQCKYEIKLHEESISKIADELKEFKVELAKKQKYKADILKENQELNDKLERSTLEMEERAADFERLKLQLSGKINAAKNSLAKIFDLQISRQNQQVAMLEVEEKTVKCIEIITNAPKPLTNKSDLNRLKRQIAEDEFNVLKNQNMIQLQREKLQLEQLDLSNLQQQANTMAAIVLDNEKDKTNLTHILEKVNAERLELQEAKVAQDSEEAALTAELQLLTSERTNLAKRKNDADVLHAQELKMLQEKRNATKADYDGNKVVLKTWHNELIIYKKGIKECKAKLETESKAKETKREKPRSNEEQATAAGKDTMNLSGSSQSSMASYNGVKVPKFNPAVFKFPPKKK